MAKTKSTIISIMHKNPVPFDPGAVFYPVGGQPLTKAGEVCVGPDGAPAFTNVSDIKFCRHAYGQGAAVDQPCYVVSFEDVSQVVVIPAEDIGPVCIFKGDINTEEVPALPEQ